MRDVLLKRADYIPEQERDEYLGSSALPADDEPGDRRRASGPAFYVYNSASR